MPLVNAKCTNCGANLTVDKSKDAAICQYCGSAFIVEKAINNYNITNTINAGVVNIYNTTSDFEIVGGVLVRYNGESLDPVIPSNVIKIGHDAFRGTMIRSVVIPESVVEIAEKAFANCSYLKKVKIPSRVRKINHVFWDSKGIEEVELPEGMEEIGDYAFFGCKNLKIINIPKSVRKIGNESFSGCESLEEIILPQNVSEIEYNAFAGCKKLSKINIPRRVRYLSSAFIRCESLKEVFIPSDELQIFSGFAESGVRKIVFSDNLKKLTGEFGSCHKLKEVVIPAKVIKSIPFYSFREMFLYTPFWENYTREHRLCPYCGKKLNLFGKCSVCGKPKYVKYN